LTSLIRKSKHTKTARDMSKIQFREPKLGKESLKRVYQINEILEDYERQGYKLTLRQLYYRLVSKNIIANKVAEYDKLSRILTEGRMGGLVDWNSIEDRLRLPSSPYTNDDIEDAINDAHDHYRLDRQIGQENYIELWVEKDAISNVLKKRTMFYGVPLMVNRGYSSTTAMHDAYNRLENAARSGKQTHILYLGDHDPSGLDMVLNDIPKRLNDDFGTSVTVEHIGITMPQIAQYNPPPNPAKISDPRAGWYISNYGHTSYEVDALEPKDLHLIINDKIENLMDMKVFQAHLDQEVVDKEVLKKLPKANESYQTLIKYIDETEDCLRQLNKGKSLSQFDKGQLETLMNLKKEFLG